MLNPPYAPDPGPFSLSTRIVAGTPPRPENRISPRLAETQEPKLGGSELPPSIEATPVISVREIHSAQFKRVIEIVESGHLQPTMLQVRECLLLGQQLVDAYRYSHLPGICYCPPSRFTSSNSTSMQTPLWSLNSNLSASKRLKNCGGRARMSGERAM